MDRLPLRASPSSRRPQQITDAFRTLAGAQYRTFDAEVKFRNNQDVKNVRKERASRGGGCAGVVSNSRRPSFVHAREVALPHRNSNEYGCLRPDGEWGGAAARLRPAGLVGVAQHWLAGCLTRRGKGVKGVAKWPAKVPAYPCATRTNAEASRNNPMSSSELRCAAAANSAEAGMIRCPTHRERIEGVLPTACAR